MRKDIKEGVKYDTGGGAVGRAIGGISALSGIGTTIEFGLESAFGSLIGITRGTAKGIFREFLGDQSSREFQLPGGETTRGLYQKLAQESSKSVWSGLSSSLRSKRTLRLGDAFSLSERFLDRLKI